MRKFILAAVVVLLVAGESGGAEKHKIYGWFVAGVPYGGYMGEGTSGDTFGRAIGVFGEFGLALESGLAWTVYGGSYAPVKNTYRASTADAKFGVPYYTEIRKIWFKGSFHPYLLAGYGFAMMKFDNVNEWDYHHLAAAGAGVQWRNQGGFLLQLAVRPYLVKGNSLGQSKGVEVQFGIGLGGWIE